MHKNHNVTFNLNKFRRSEQRRIKVPVFLVIFFFFLQPVLLSAYQQDDSTRSVNPSDSSNAIEQHESTSAAPLNDSAAYAPRKLTAEELIRGERLFYGLISVNGKSVNCASCHNTTVSDTMNWNPDAMAISIKYLNKSPEDLSKVLLNPAGIRMAEVHKGFQFTPADIVMLKGYMDEFTSIGLAKQKPVITNLLIFIVCLVLFLLAFTDLIITKKIRQKWLVLLILTGSLAVITKILVTDAIALGRSQNYSPFQPVKFSHAIHAGQNQIDCIYCHSYAPYSKVAGIPPVNVCMNCHLMVRNGTRSGAFEIAKIIEAYDNKVPIRWIKVHNLPDFVFFSHAQHVGAGGVECSECHGEVEKMDVIIQVSDLSMGWCINCHRTKKIDFHDNEYFTQYRELTMKLKSEKADSVTIGMLGGTECMKCHY